MSMLTIDDPLISVLDLDANEFRLAAAKAQALAEGAGGANRCLERRVVTSVLRLANGQCYLPESPVDISEPIQVWVKPVKKAQHTGYYERPGISHGNTFGRSHLAGSYLTESTTAERLLDPSQVSFDPALNRLQCSVNRSTHTPMSDAGHMTARVIYTAGYDFSVGSEDVNAIAMKAALLDLIKASAATTEGISEFTLDDFYKVKISSSNVGDLRSGALEVFRSFSKR